MARQKAPSLQIAGGDIQGWTHWYPPSTNLKAEARVAVPPTLLALAAEAIELERRSRVNLKPPQRLPRFRLWRLSDMIAARSTTVSAAVAAPINSMRRSLTLLAAFAIAATLVVALVLPA
jgi:hypothetical protein